MSPIDVQKRTSNARGSISSRRYLENLDEGELFMELIRDIANELDINILCHKILVNVGLLTHADRGSLFLAKGPPNNRHLVAKLFDVTQDTGKFLLTKIMIALISHLPYLMSLASNTFV